MDGLLPGMRTEDPVGRKRMNEIGKRIADKLAEIHGSKTFSIAFLPYKRSMWNSMSSVYTECWASGAYARVIPLPYQRIVDGKVESIDCDRDKFMAQALDVKALDKEHFDFVVIHYPYDDKNKVTRMCPEYHTAELRKYGKVVYIPYSCTWLRSILVQPGVANVDYAFLASEDQAKYFINEWQSLGVDFTGRAFGLGSPKMDIIANLEQGKSEYLTTLVINSLAPYLSSPFEHIRLYQHHISNEIGRGRRVIFRPHPLLRQTIKSMRPDTMSEYEKFLTWCETRDHVEVDETEYLEDALEQADYLIGDPSSVLEMWASTGREYTII